MGLFYLLLLPQAVNFLLALIPALLLLRYFYRRDPRPEPRRTVTKAFLLGICATFPALLIELTLSRLTPAAFSPLGAVAFKAFIIAGLVEESCKLYMVKRFLYPLPEFDETTDGIVYTMAAGLGFAFLENILYSMGSSRPWSLLIMRGVTSVPLHGLASGLMGYYVGKAKMESRKLIPLGLLWAVIYHGAYDFVLFYGSATAWLSLVILGILLLHMKGILKTAIGEDRRSFRS